MMLLFILIATALVVVFGLLAFLFFRSRWTTLGAVSAVFCLLFALADLKLLQFYKLASMPPPSAVATVSSAPVKEEDWAPTLSAVGSVSAVQGAIVSAELAGTVAEIDFQNGAVAKKDDVLAKLDTSSEEAQL